MYFAQWASLHVVLQYRKAKTLSQKQFGEVLNPSLKVNRSDCLSEKLYSMSVYLIRSLEAIRISVRLSVCQSVCPYGVYTSDCLSVCPSVRISVYLIGSLSACPYICPFVCLPVHLSLYLSVCMFDCLSVSAVYPYVCLFDWLSVSISISVCLSVWLSICPNIYLSVSHMSPLYHLSLSHLGRKGVPPSFVGPKVLIKKILRPEMEKWQMNPSAQLLVLWKSQTKILNWI